MIAVSILFKSLESHNIARTASVVPAGTEPFAEIEALRGTGLNYLSLDNIVKALAMRVFWFIPFLTRAFIPDRRCLVQKYTGSTLRKSLSRRFETYCKVTPSRRHAASRGDVHKRNTQL